MRIVCDTNVLIAGVVADGLSRDLVKRRLPKHDLFVSEILLAELEEKLRDKFDVDPSKVPLVETYRQQATLVEPVPLTIPISRDPDDDVVLATAIAARADVIITGDNDLLVLRQYDGIQIVSPRQFLEMVDNPDR